MYLLQVKKDKNRKQALKLLKKFKLRFIIKGKNIFFKRYNDAYLSMRLLDVYKLRNNVVFHLTF